MCKESMEHLMSSAQVPQIVDEKLEAALRQIQEMKPEQQETDYKQSEKENEPMNKKKFLLPFASAAAGLLFCSVTALAAWNFAREYVSPNEVAEQLGKTKLSAVYDGENSIIEPMTQSAGEYDFTLLGMANGVSYEMFNREEVISLLDQDVIEDEKQKDCSIFVLAISKSDQTPMPDDKDPEFDMFQFDIQTYVQGYEPKQYNASSMGGISVSSKVIDGVQYHIVRTSNMETLADRKVYFAVRADRRTTTWATNAFLMDETTGEIYINPEYDKLAVLFELPLDPSKADPEKAEEILNAWK